MSWDFIPGIERGTWDTVLICHALALHITQPDSCWSNGAIPLWPYSFPHVHSLVNLRYGSLISSPTGMLLGCRTKPEKDKDVKFIHPSIPLGNQGHGEDGANAIWHWVTRHWDTLHTHTLSACFGDIGRNPHRHQENQPSVSNLGPSYSKATGLTTAPPYYNCATKASMLNASSLFNICSSAYF